MNKRKGSIVLGGMAGFGRALLEILGAGGRLSQTMARSARERVRVQSETRDDAGLMKAADIKRLRRQQRNVLLSEKGAFDDSRLTYPLTGARSARRLLGSMDAASRGTSAAMQFSNMNGVRVFADGKEIVGFG